MSLFGLTASFHQLVVEGAVSITILMFISASFVCAGFLVGIVVIAKSKRDLGAISARSPLLESLRDSSDGSQSEEDQESAESGGWWQRKRTRMEAKLLVFRRQLQCLERALRCRSLLALLFFWVMGNAVFSVRCSILPP